MGLGTGTIAACGVSWADALLRDRPDPAVRDIAADPTSPQFLADSAADTDVVVGDGRLRGGAGRPGGLMDLAGWESLDGEARLWTDDDDYSSVVGVLRL